MARKLIRGNGNAGQLKKRIKETMDSEDFRKAVETDARAVREMLNEELERIYPTAGKKGKALREVEAQRERILQSIESHRKNRNLQFKQGGILYAQNGQILTDF